MSKATAKRIKDPLRKERGKSTYNPKIGRLLSTTYRMSCSMARSEKTNQDEAIWQKFEKISKLINLDDAAISLGEPKHQQEIAKEIREHFFNRAPFIYDELLANQIWHGFAARDYLCDPGFLYFVIKNNLDQSDAFFVHMLEARPPDAMCGRALASIEEPTSGPQPFVSLAPWGYISCPTQNASVCAISKFDPFRQVIADDPTFRAGVELCVAALQALEGRGVSEYFVPDANYLPVFLTTGFDLSERRIYVSDCHASYEKLHHVYCDANSATMSDESFRGHVQERPNLVSEIVEQSLSLYEDQALFYELPFMLPAHDLIAAIQRRLELMRPGAILTFSILNNCPSNAHWFSLLGYDAQLELLNSLTMAGADGKSIGAKKLVELAIGSMSVPYGLECIESHDDNGNLVASQFIITR